VSESENTVPDTARQPGKYGGWLKRGNPGNKGGGRQKDRVRETCLLGFEERIHWLRKIADGKIAATVKERLTALDLLGKYGGLQKIETETHDGTLEDLMREAAAGEVASDGDGPA
jgi:hypothetical protein